MVKVTGPMMSMTASGTLANTIVFSSWKGRPYVRNRVIPANPKSVAQVGRRIMFKFLSQQWASLPNQEQMAYKELADSLAVSKFNAYVQINMMRWNVGDAPSQQYPATETGSIGVSATPDFSWSGNQVVWGCATFTVNDNWGLILHVHEDTGFTPSINTARLVIVKQDAGEEYIYWTPPKVETLYCRLQAFTTDGVLGTAETEIEAAP